MNNLYFCIKVVLILLLPPPLPAHYDATNIKGFYSVGQIFEEVMALLQNYVCLHFFKYTSFHVEPASTFANPSIMAILPMCWHNVHHYNALPFGR